MQLNQASILIVDDEPVLLEIKGEWFQDLARHVFCAADGVQALEVLAVHKIDAIITDVRMPVMDGITLVKKIQAGGAHTPSLIFITGFADIEARDAYDLGVEALLEKPIERDDLVEVVRHSVAGPGERWEKRVNLSAGPILTKTFPSLAVALKERQIAFGRGGFCIEDGEFLTEGPVSIALDFTKDGYVLSGQGIVRWLANEENQMGIELTYVAEHSRARAIELTKGAFCFIPRTTGHRYEALAG
jgi:CheY-like chemotaxis protein